jgi:hypothetical protein
MGLELNVAFVPNFNIYMIQYYLCHIICIVFYFIDSDELFLLPQNHFPMQKGYFPMQHVDVADS